MGQKRHEPKEIVAKLRHDAALVLKGRSVAEAVRSIGVTPFTCYRWRREHGGLKTDRVKRSKELEKENERLGKAVSDLTLEKLILKDVASGHSWVPPAAGPAFIMSGRRPACRGASPVAGSASTAPIWRKALRGQADEDALTADIIALASQHGRYGYRRIAAMLRDAGWAVNVKRVERTWRREGPKLPQTQPEKGRLCLNDGSCVRLRLGRPDHVWPCDFVESRTHDGRKFRMLDVIGEFTRECPAIRIDRTLNPTAALDALTDLFLRRGMPGHVRPDNGPESIAKAVRDWIDAVGAKTAFIEPGSPRENGYCGSFNSAFRDELPNGEI